MRPLSASPPIDSNWFIEFSSFPELAEFNSWGVLFCGSELFKIEYYWLTALEDLLLSYSNLTLGMFMPNLVLFFSPLEVWSPWESICPNLVTLSPEFGFFRFNLVPHSDSWSGNSKNLKTSWQCLHESLHLSNTSCIHLCSYLMTGLKTLQSIHLFSRQSLFWKQARQN